MADGPSYPVSAFELQYVRENPGLPPIEELLQLEVELGRSYQGYVAPRENVPSITLRLGDASEPAEPYFASAIQHILEGIRDHLVGLQLMGIYVAPDLSQINEEGDDLRDPGRTQLRILITIGVVTELRTLASGERIPTEERVDNPLHERIRLQSPVQPFVDPEQPQQDLLRKDALDRYVFFLSRHPGRRVDMALSPAVEEGGTALDYLVTENRAFSVYAQVANTGTRSTKKWRERFGFFHTQLTNNDDILEFDYNTAAFDDYHALRASYEAPWGDNERLRWHVNGSVSDFNASDVGFFADLFEGDSWSIGGGLIANVYQQKEFFLDVVGGARLLSEKVNNPLVGKGRGDFFLPYVGVRFERTTELMSSAGLLNIEWHTGAITDIDRADLDRLGRTSADEDFAVLRWRFDHSMYLEPLVNRAGWEDPTTPETSTLAHELILSFWGQYAFDNRLIPSLERPLGGLYTVRGYPESVVAGDTAVVGSIEYRYHLPRALGLDPEPGTLFNREFRFAPQYTYGSTDWDLILKAFFDVGRTIISDPLSFESDETLLGTGVGVELRYERNIRLRLDWGIAIESIPSRGVKGGSDRVHFVATVLF